MILRENSQLVQAFPIAPHTYVGVPNAFNPRGYNILHAAEDVDVTFDFGTQGSVTVSLPKSGDVAIHPSCVAITSTATVWIS